MQTALPAPPSLDFFAHVHAMVDRPLEVGRTAFGLRRMVSIAGGQVQGQGWRARILPGGADYQLMVSATMASLQAHYVLETDAGEMIYVYNQAIRTAPESVMAALLRGEPVDPQQVYFRCCPRFETASQSLSWINERLFVGSGLRTPDAVIMDFFVLN